VSNSNYQVMQRLIYSLPEQLKEGWQIGTDCQLAGAGHFENVVIAGMGGSAIGGDVVRSLLFNDGYLPVLVWRDYILPSVVDNRTVLFAISYSGNTEETLSVYEQAKDKCGQLVVITSGGELVVKAKRDGVPVLKIAGGMPPRCAIGLVSVPILAVLYQLGITRSYQRDVNETALVIAHNCQQWHRRGRQISRMLCDRLPVVYSTSRLLDAVAYRWQCQLNENAKVMCHSGFLPEQSHNELMGFGSPNFLDKMFFLVFLLDSTTSQRTRVRLNQMLKLIGDTIAGKALVKSQGRSPMARLFSAVVMGDLTSLELAKLRDVDPIEIPRIERLKQVLNRTKRYKI